MNTQSTSLQPMTESQRTPSLMARLRDETRDNHKALEELPFNRWLMEHRLPLPMYVQLLSSYKVLFEKLERLLVNSSHPFVQAVWQDNMTKVPALSADLEVLSATLGSCPEATQSAAEITQSFSDESEGGLLRLLGALYVLEGSTLGGTIIKKHLATMYQLQHDAGLAYYNTYGPFLGRHWKAFVGRMNALPLTEQQADQVVEGADQMFAQIGAIMEEIQASNA
ncbi:MAG: biliverdin-producing heme oxygenase [Deltaproteobacteria bacterium]|nr:MAG: biliverdin-producing heme oxygenase [Deltaproteobacteria bacterium]